jgi:N-acyl-L-homoserine lactone synthetase
MTLRVRVARTTEELDAVFCLRHQVFVDEEGYMPPRPDGRIADRFDAYPTSANIVAVVDGKVAGSIRFMERSSAGVSTDEFFDFAGLLPTGRREGASGMLVVAREHRTVPRLVVAMIGMGYYWAASRGIELLLGTINPERRQAFLRSGYREVAPEFHDEERGLDVQPVILELASLSDRFLAFVRRQQIEHWLAAFQREFHEQGDYVVKRGDPGDAAFVIVDGRVEVLTPGGTVICELGPGDLFGELALLTSQPRTADVVATTDLDLMVLERNEFRRRLREKPAAAAKLLELLASRTAGMVEDLSLGPKYREVHRFRGYEM